MFGELFRYIVNEYWRELTLSRASKFSKQIGERLTLDERTIAAQLETDDELPMPSKNTRRQLVGFVVEGLKGKIPGCDETWFEQPSVEALKNRIQRDREKLDKQQVFELRIPTRPKIQAQLKQELCI